MTCAFAVRGALKKFSGVESVDVSLNKGLATVKLSPGNAIQPQQFWEAIRKNGFTPKETRVVVRGHITLSAGKSQLQVSGTNQLFDLKADPKVLEDLTREPGKSVTVEGSLTPAKDLKGNVPLEVRSFQNL